VADTKKPAIKVSDYRLYELERIAADALREGESCIKGRRVDIERLILEKFRLKIELFTDLRRRWDAYAFIDTTAKVIFIDADLMNEKRLEKKYRFTLAEELGIFSSTGSCSSIATPPKTGCKSRKCWTSERKLTWRATPRRWLRQF